MNFKNLELTFLESYIDKHFESLTNANNHIKSYNQKKKFPKETKWCVLKVSEAGWVVCDESESMADVCVLIVAT